MCIFIKSDNSKCRIPSKDDYCHIHRNREQSSFKVIYVDSEQEIIDKLKAKIKLQAEEITILNNRLSVANRKLQIIDQVDKIKYKLAPECIGRSFRDAIQDTRLKEEVEELFNASQEQCLAIYDSLLNKRNMLVHRYTAKDWNSNIQLQNKKKHGYTINKLCSSIKSYEILRMLERQGQLSK